MNKLRCEACSTWSKISQTLSKNHVCLSRKGVTIREPLYIVLVANWPSNRWGDFFEPSINFSFMTNLRNRCPRLGECEIINTGSTARVDSRSAPITREMWIIGKIKNLGAMNNADGLEPTRGVAYAKGSFYQNVERCWKFSHLFVLRCKGAEIVDANFRGCRVHWAYFAFCSGQRCHSSGANAMHKVATWPMSDTMSLALWDIQWHIRPFYANWHNEMYRSRWLAWTDLAS